MRLLRGRRRRRQFRLTREGKGFVFVTVGVGFAAVNTANNLLYLILGLLLSLLLVSGVLSDLALWKVRVKRYVPTRLFSGTATLMEVEIENKKRSVSSIAVKVSEDTKQAETSPAHFLRVAPGEKQRIAYRFKPMGRGVIMLDKMRMSTCYPFGLIEKSDPVTVIDEMVVYPALVTDITLEQRGVTHGDVAHSERTGSGSDFSGSIREYRAGDVTKDIHWRRSAARGELVVRERSQEVRENIVLHINNQCDVGMSHYAKWHENFEREVSKVATAAAMHLSKGASVRVIAENSSSAWVAAGSDPDPIWRFLALLEPIHDVTDIKTIPPKVVAA